MGGGFGGVDGELAEVVPEAEEGAFAYLSGGVCQSGEDLGDAVGFQVADGADQADRGADLRVQADGPLGGFVQEGCEVRICLGIRAARER